MIIKADKEGKAVLTGICDAARKVCSLQEVAVVLAVLNSIQEIEDEDKKVQGKCRENKTSSDNVEEGKQSPKAKD
jgi:hypothetical protein